MNNEVIENMLEQLRQELDEKTERFFRDLEEVRQQVERGKISQKNAQDRIDELERNFDDLRREVKQISKDIAKMNSTIDTFSPKLDKFMDNLWRAFFILLVIVAGLVGIKLW